MTQGINSNLETKILNCTTGSTFELKINLPDRIYDHVLTQIFLGNLSFGQRIRESQVTKELDVSNVPVREAFIRLREEGWIETVPNCGARVVNYHDSQKHKELYIMRLSVESGIFYCLAVNITREQLAELEAVVHELENAHKDADVDAYHCLDAEFHMKAAFFAGGERMRKIYRPIFLQWCIMIHLYREISVYPNSISDISKKPKELAHKALCNALKAKDAPMAVELIRNHFCLPT